MSAAVDCSPSPPPRGVAWARRAPAVLGAVGVACLGVYFARELEVAGAIGLPLDDGWIHLQFARNLADGAGLAYRPGTLVPGSTAPLWTALLSLLFWLPGPLLLWVKLLGALLYLAGAALVYVLARELDLEPPLATGAALLFLVTDAMLWSALSGMEVGLFVALSLGGTVLHLRERRAPRSSGFSLAVLGVASLARPEGLLLLAAAAADRVLCPPPGAHRREVLRAILPGAACAIALIGAVQIFSLAVTDSPLPTTFAVKTDGVRALVPSSVYLLRVLGILFRQHPVVVLLAAAGALALIERLGTARDRGLLPVLWTAGLPLAYSLFDAPDAPMMVGNFGRYHFPLIPFVLVLGGLALERPLRRLAGAAPARRALATALLAMAFLAPPLFALASGSERFALNVRNVNQSDLAMSLWMREHIPPDATVAAQDVGAVGFFTANPLLDLTGIVTPEILPWLDGTAGGPGGRAGLERFVAERRPPFLMFFVESYPGLLETLGGEVLHRLRVDRNVTMAGTELVLARVPWDRESAASAQDEAAATAAVGNENVSK